MNIVAEIDKGWYLLRRCGNGINNDTAPQVTRLERVEIEPSDDSEIVRSTFERLVQICVLLGVGVYNGAVTKDDLI